MRKKDSTYFLHSYSKFVHVSKYYLQIYYIEKIRTIIIRQIDNVMIVRNS